MDKKLKNYKVKKLTPPSCERCHTRINDDLCTRLKGMDGIHKNVEYNRRGNAIGEIDTFAYKWVETEQGLDLYGYVFEVKSTMSPYLRTKANKQLKRSLEKFIPLIEKGDDVKFNKVFVYYVNPEQVMYQNKRIGYKSNGDLPLKK